MSFRFIRYRFFKMGLFIIFGLILTLGFNPQVMALTAEEINQISQSITVLIDGLNPGSGVIIAKNQNTYYVLTANHVVKTPDEYTVITVDGEQYPIDYNQVIKLPGVDLAIIPFTSDKIYAVARLADYNYDSQSEYIFISGWPDSKLPIADRRRVFATGLLISEAEKNSLIKEPFTRGYDLFYTNRTQVGMSGSPILDREGRVIGIHGQSEGQIFSNPELGSVSRVTLGYSAGIPLQKFLQSGITLNLNISNQPPNPMNARELKSIHQALKPPEFTGESTALDWSNRGNQFYRLEQWQEALKAFDQAIAIQSNFHPAWYGRGNSLVQLKRYQEAVESYSRTTQLQRDFYLAWREKGKVLIKLKQYEDALLAWNQMLIIKPEDYQIWYLRGNLLMNQLKQHQEAIQSYNRAINLKPDFVPALINRGIAYYQIQDYQEAILSFDQGLKLDDQQETIWQLRGEILMKLQLYSQALSSVEKALNLADQNPQLWMLKAQILARMKQYQNARNSALMALKFKPRDREIMGFIRSLSPPRR
ncbi:Tetratricopeptide repeat protein TPR_2 [Planktothrix sp. PCC 11201]|uniref:tetratricopeptide repeat-containing S1 family peptidase n=1 Tax=Planktothrix sp. PCC 11201 TaxID=1729650 RepID=UPI00091A3058|nr:tetratricopeptide repeat-containing serine protease family protein [Planktothrix sp. PCC 11201]SKB15337.1 Tetratricopeptide repeat protein TPR_2 [Planktothrix sp. PCC 11201]